MGGKAGLPHCIDSTGFMGSVAMTETKMTNWQRFLAWFAAGSVVLVVTGYATAEQWMGFVLGIFAGR